MAGPEHEAASYICATHARRMRGAAYVYWLAMVASLCVISGRRRWAGALLTWALLTAVPAHTRADTTWVLAGATDSGFYQLRLSPDGGAPEIGVLHAWIVQVSDERNVAFVPAHLSVSGGMPTHGHGLPTEPEISRFLGNGRFRLDGVRFNMAGEWEFTVRVVGPRGPDQATFALHIPPSKTSGSAPPGRRIQWLTEQEEAIARSMGLSRLREPTDPSNALIGDPRAIALGKRLFFDTGLSRSGSVSCATCHDPERGFSDGRARSVGSAETTRHSPSLVGAAFSRWFYWDGRRDSLWAQAVTPLETAGEMDNDRVAVVRYVLTATHLDTDWMPEWRELRQLGADDRLPQHAGPFGGSSEREAWFRLNEQTRTAVNRAFVAIGKSIAAFEWTLRWEMSRFDLLVADAEKFGAMPSDSFTADERAGLKLFLDVGRTDCLRCHNTPTFTNNGFHNVGTGPGVDDTFDYGRAFGLQAALFDPFNCTGMFSDAPADACSTLRYTQKRTLDGLAQGAFKVPSLRQAATTPPYLHDGRLATLTEVVDWYRDPPAGVPHELRQISLSDNERDQLVAFLRTLSPVSIAKTAGPHASAGPAVR